MRRATAYPSRTGSPMSTRATSGLPSIAFSIPSSPFSAATTSCPRFRRRLASPSRRSSLSSTTRIRRLSPGSGSGTPAVGAGASTAPAPECSRGSRTTNVLPFPGPGLKARTVPPCISTKRRTSVSPIPRPPWERSSVLSAWAKRSKIRGSICGSIPTPVSATRISPEAPSASRVTSTRPPGGVYLIALVRRLLTICSSRTGSPSRRQGSDPHSHTRSIRRETAAAEFDATQRSTTSRTSRGARWSVTLPEATRETSSRSSTRRERRPVCLRMIERSLSELPRPCSISCAAVRIAPSGFRSSWPRMARNSSRLRTSSSSRASRSRTSYCCRRARSAARTALASETLRIGRSSSVTAARSFNRRTRGDTASRVEVPAGKRRTGRFDHGSWAASASSTSCVEESRASSVRSATPAPLCISMARATRSGQISQEIPSSARSRFTSAASRPLGATTRTRSSRGSVPSMRITLRQHPCRSLIDRAARHHADEYLQGLADRQPAAVHHQSAQGLLVPAAPLLDDGDRLSDRALVLEVAQDDDGVGEVADVEGRFRVRAEQPVLGERRDDGHPAHPQEGEELVKLCREEVLLRHGSVEPAQAVDDDQARVLLLDRATDLEDELAGGELGRVDRPHEDAPLLGEALERLAHRRAAHEESREALLEDVDGGALAPDGRRHRVLAGDDGLAGPRRPEEERRRSAVEPSAQQRVELGDPARQRLEHKVAAVVGDREPGEHHQAAGGDREVVEASANRHRPHLEHAKAASLGAVERSELLEAQDAVSDALELQVRRSRVVQEEDGALSPGEEVL